MYKTIRLLRKKWILVLMSVIGFSSAVSSCDKEDSHIELMYGVPYSKYYPHIETDKALTQHVVSSHLQMQENSDNKD